MNDKLLEYLNGSDREFLQFSEFPACRNSIQTGFSLEPLFCSII